MKIHLTRESVCAADDIDAPHARQIQVPDDCCLDEIVSYIMKHYELPHIAGGKATWCISSMLPLAVVTQQWRNPEMIRSIPPGLDELDCSNGVLRVNISYFAQIDPDVVLTVLRELRLRAT